MGLRYSHRGALLSPGTTTSYTRWSGSTEQHCGLSRGSVTVFLEGSPRFPIVYPPSIARKTIHAEGGEARAMGGVAGLRVALLCIAAGLQTWAGVEGELVLLVTLTRHGSRVSSTAVLVHDRPGTAALLYCRVYLPVGNIYHPYTWTSHALSRTRLICCARERRWHLQPLSVLSVVLHS